MSKEKIQMSMQVLTSPSSLLSVFCFVLPFFQDLICIQKITTFPHSRRSRESICIFLFKVACKGTFCSSRITEVGRRFRLITFNLSFCSFNSAFFAVQLNKTKSLLPIFSYKICSKGKHVSSTASSTFVTEFVFALVPVSVYI